MRLEAKGTLQPCKIRSHKMRELIDLRSVLSHGKGEMAGKSPAISVLKNGVAILLELYTPFVPSRQFVLFFIWRYREKGVHRCGFRWMQHPKQDRPTQRWNKGYPNFQLYLLSDPFVTKGETSRGLHRLLCTYITVPMSE